MEVKSKVIQIEYFSTKNTFVWKWFSELTLSCKQKANWNQGSALLSEGWVIPKLSFSWDFIPFQEDCTIPQSQGPRQCLQTAGTLNPDCLAPSSLSSLSLATLLVGLLYKKEEQGTLSMKPRLTLHTRQGLPLTNAQLATTGPTHHLQKPTRPQYGTIFQGNQQLLGQIDYFGSLPYGVCVTVGEQFILSRSDSCSCYEFAFLIQFPQQHYHSRVYKMVIYWCGLPYSVA